MLLANQQQQANVQRQGKCCHKERYRKTHPHLVHAGSAVIRQTPCDCRTWRTNSDTLRLPGECLQTDSPNRSPPKRGLAERTATGLGEPLVDQPVGWPRQAKTANRTSQLDVHRPAALSPSPSRRSLTGTHCKKTDTSTCSVPLLTRKLQQAEAPTPALVRNATGTRSLPPPKRKAENVCNNGC